VFPHQARQIGQLGETILYNTKPIEATAAAALFVECHALLHEKSSKAAKACAAADVVDGRIVLHNPTIRLAAAAYGVSLGSVARARRLSRAERDAVKRGERPLVLPQTLSAPSAVDWLMSIVKDLGVDRVLDLLAATEKVAA